LTVGVPENPEPNIMTDLLPSFVPDWGTIWVRVAARILSGHIKDKNKKQKITLIFNLLNIL